MSFTDRLLATALLLVLGLGASRELSYRLELQKIKPPIVVDVRGEVIDPQVLSLPTGARVVHALTLCGGLTAKAELGTLSLAETLVDGQTVEVARRGSNPEHSAGPEQTQNSPSLVDLNRAAVGELESLPGVGPVLAQRIVEGRQKRQGGFTSLEDLSTIRGIKGKTLLRLRPHIKIEGL